jgi:hypothetical protein
MKIKELLSDKSRWCQGTYAKNQSDISVMPTSEAACKWCLSGATLKITNGEYQSEIWDKINVYIANKYEMSVPKFNDTHTYEEVMEVVNELDV